MIPDDVMEIATINRLRSLVRYAVLRLKYDMNRDGLQETSSTLGLFWDNSLFVSLMRNFKRQN